MRTNLYANVEGCYVCGYTYVEHHHVYPSSRRPISDEEGCVAPLCREHHQGRSGVHSDRRLDRWLKAECQRRWEAREIEEFGIGKEEARERFRRRFYDSYVEEDEDERGA